MIKRMKKISFFYLTYIYYNLKELIRTKKEKKKRKYIFFTLLFTSSFSIKLNYFIQNHQKLFQFN